MSSYPWSVLGLEKRATEAEIRTAYARRLKVVRPDTDPTGFQALVEARGHALALARSRADILEEDDEFEEDENGDEEGEDESRTSSEPAALANVEVPVAISPPMSVGPAASPVLMQTLPAAADGGGAGAGALPSVVIELSGQALPVEALDLSETQEDLPPPATGEPTVFPIARAPVPEATPSGSAPSGDVLVSPDDVLASFRSLLNSETDSAGSAHLAAQAQPALADLGRLPRSARKAIEPDILQAMTTALKPIPRVAWPRWTKLLQWLHLVSDPSARHHMAGRSRRTLFRALDEEYGWTVSDRRVFQVLPMTQAAALMAQLHAAEREERIVRDGLPPRWDSDGLPILDPQDMQAFFGSELATYSARYQQARGARKWAATWRPWLFLLGPLWATSLRQYRVLGIWLAALLVSGQLIAAAERNAAWLNSVQVDLISLATMAALAPLAAVHIYIARNNERLEIERLARLSETADRRGLFDPDSRAQFFKQRAPSFRFKASTDDNGFWNSRWFWIILGVTILRIVGAFMK